MKHSDILRIALSLALVAGGAVTISASAPAFAKQPKNQCDRVATTNWQSWVDKMPGPGRNRPTLHVVARANTTDAGNSAGWVYRLDRGKVRESLPPIQTVEFVAYRGTYSGPNKPRDPAQIHGTFTGAESRYAEIIVTCKGRIIARINPETVY